jgi:IS30 family transposase
MEMIAKGVSIRAACRELGTARSGAHRWLYCGTVVLKDGRVKHTPPIDRIMAREISPRYLSELERIRIADLLAQGMNASQIAHELGRAVSTVSRELRRNAHATSSYRPFHAHALAAGRQHRPKALKVVTHPELAAVIEGKLRVRWSPAQISRYLKATFPDDGNMHLSHESIYVALYRNKSPLHTALRNSPLRTGRDHRRAHIKRVMTCKRFAQPMLSINERDFDPTDRSTPGNWGGDLIIGKGQRSAIGTLVERKSRYVKLLHLGWRDSTSLHHAITPSRQA